MTSVEDTRLVENNEPSESEVKEYAKWLGMKFPEDEPFIWIAKEGLKAPLPENWSACRSAKGELYYYNLKTGQSIWDHPLDDHFRSLYTKEKKLSDVKNLSTNDQKHSTKDGLVAEEKSPKRKNIFSSKSKVGALKLLKLKKDISDVPGSNVKELPNVNLGFTDQKAGLVDVTERPKDSSGVEENITSTVDDLCVSDDKVLDAQKEDENKRIVFIEQLEVKFQEFQVEQLKEHQNEKEVYEQKLKDSWVRSKCTLDSMYEKKADNYKNELSNKFFAEKKRLEEEFSENLQKLSDTLAHEFKEESERMRRQLIERQEKTKLDVEESWSLVIKDLECKFRQEKNELERQKNDELKVFFDQRARDLESLRVLKDDGIEILRSYCEEVEKSAVLFTETSRKAYMDFGNVLRDTQNNISKAGERNLAQLSEEMRQMCDIELEKIKNYYNFEVRRIKSNFRNDLVMMSAAQQKPAWTEKEELNDRHERHNPLLEMSQPPDEKINHDINTLTPRKIPSVFSTKIQIKEPERVHDNLDNINPQNGNISESCGSLDNESDITDPKRNLVRQQKKMVNAHGAFQNLKEGEGSNTSSRNFSEKDDEHRDNRHLLRRLVSVSTDSPVYVELLNGEGLTTVITEVLRRMFTGSPFIASPTSGDSSGKQRRDLDFHVAPSATEGVETQATRQMETLPVSLQDQKQLLLSERQRIIDGKEFVETQRLCLEKRREQLKVTRRQWKQDVLSAKGDGVRSSSRQGQILNRLRGALEDQLKGLEQDETILRDSEMWLLVKEQRLEKLEQQINDLERSKAPSISINSIDTTTLVTDYFKPSRGRPASARTSIHQMFKENIVGKAEPKPLSPIYNMQLNRIARRLDEVTSMINLQNQNQSRQQYKKRFHQQKGESGQRRQSENFF